MGGQREKGRKDGERERGGASREGGREKGRKGGRKAKGTGMGTEVNKSGGSGEYFRAMEQQ